MKWPRLANGAGGRYSSTAAEGRGAGEECEGQQLQAVEDHKGVTFEAGAGAVEQVLARILEGSEAPNGGPEETRPGHKPKNASRGI